MESTKNNPQGQQPNVGENHDDAAKFNSSEHTKHVEAIDKQENPRGKKKEEEVDPIEYYGF